jgi:hypothetical protein
MALDPIANLTGATVTEAQEKIWFTNLRAWLVRTLGGETLAAGAALGKAMFGLTLSNNVSDSVNDIDIAAGGAMDTTGVYWMSLTSGLTKRLDAAWAVGTNQGGLDTGSIANDVYHLWLIVRSDTGVVDVLFSASATAPTMPANYDFKRRIGAVIRAGATILAFSQFGDEFLLSTNVTDVSATNPGTAAVTRTLPSVPDGIKVHALFVAAVSDNSGAQTDVRVVMSSLDQTDQAPGLATDTHGSVVQAAPSVNLASHASYRVRTNTSAQVRSRLSASGANTVLTVGTFGWIDARGRFD